MNSGSTYKKTTYQSAEEFRKNIASYGFYNQFNRKIYKKVIEALPDRELAFIVDGMSNKGKVGLGILERYNKEKPKARTRLAVIFNDILYEHLEPLYQKSYEIIHGDIRDLHKSGAKPDIVVVRFGIKDLPKIGMRYGIEDLQKSEQVAALQSIRNSLFPGGTFVLADMAAYTMQGQDGIIKIHSAKQMYVGRNEAEEGRCHIPTSLEWIELLNKAGFKDGKMKVYHFRSDVETSQWKGQFGIDADEGQLIQELNSVIRRVAGDNTVFAQECNVKFVGDQVFISFPIMVISADKD